MSSTLQSDLTSIQQNNYLTLVVLTVVGYDYILTLPNEIDYIWKQRFSLVSALFFLIRYVGIVYIVFYALVGSTFFSGSDKLYACSKSVYSFNSIVFQGYTVFVFSYWVVVPFIGAADLVMILRVWAIYCRSRWILGLHLIPYVVGLSFNLVTCIIYTTPNKLIASSVQILGNSYCTAASSQHWNRVSSIAQLTLSAMLSLHLIVKLAAVSFQMQRVTKRWQWNRYINLFLREGIVYFFIMLMYNTIAVLSLLQEFSGQGWGQLLLIAVVYIAMVTLLPRFIMNIRELYARNLRLGYSNHASEIDAGFGVSKESVWTTSMTAIAFADSVIGKDTEFDEEKEEIQIEERKFEGDGVGP